MTEVVANGCLRRASGVEGDEASRMQSVLVVCGLLPSNTDWSSERDVYSNSMFCVSPAGDSLSIVWLNIVLMSTCIPVNVNDFVQLPLEETLPMKWTDLSVNIKEAACCSMVSLTRFGSWQRTETSSSRRRRLGEEPAIC